MRPAAFLIGLFTLLFCATLAQAESTVLFQDDFEDQDLVGWELVPTNEWFEAPFPGGPYNGWAADGVDPLSTAYWDFGYDEPAHSPGIGKLTTGQREGQIKVSFPRSDPNAKVTLTFTVHNPNGGISNTKAVFGLLDSTQPIPNPDENDPNYPDTNYPELGKGHYVWASYSTPYTVLDADGPLVKDDLNGNGQWDEGEPYYTSGFMYMQPEESVDGMLDYFYFGTRIQEPGRDINILTEDALDAGISTDDNMWPQPDFQDWTHTLKLVFDPANDLVELYCFVHQNEGGVVVDEIETLMARWDNWPGIESVDTLYIGQEEGGAVASQFDDFLIVQELAGFDADLNGDGVVDSEDIDYFYDHMTDLNEDGTVNGLDAVWLVEQGIGTCMGDATLDGSVDEADLAWVADGWKQGTGHLWGSGDFTGNGEIDEEDLAWLADNWKQCGTPASVPEPATLGLLALTGLAIRRR
jgi:hypothetical protein